MLTPRSHMFAAVSAMNVAFGNPVGLSAHLLLPKEHPVFIRYMEMLEKQTQNIPEEYKELQAAIAAKDITKIRDALCDIMVFCLGAFHRLGLDADDDMRAVVEGVNTRFCHNMEDIDATVKKWGALGVTDVIAGGKFPFAYIKANSDVTSTKGEFIPKGKFLKSVNNRDPVFTEIRTLEPQLPGMEVEVPLETTEAEAKPRVPAIGEPAEVPKRAFLGQPPAPPVVKAVVHGGAATPVSAAVNEPTTLEAPVEDGIDTERAHQEAWALLRKHAFEAVLRTMDDVSPADRRLILADKKEAYIKVTLSHGSQA